MATWIIGIVVIGLLVFAGYKTVKRSKSCGCGCCPGCSGIEKCHISSK